MEAVRQLAAFVCIVMNFQIFQKFYYHTKIFIIFDPEDLRGDLVRIMDRRCTLALLYCMAAVMPRRLAAKSKVTEKV
jgi:hypothetical protein